MEKNTYKLWGGRFDKELSDILLEYTSSIRFDKVLYSQEIRVNIAYAKCLELSNVISSEEYEIIVSALRDIKAELDGGIIDISHKFEDIHTLIEWLLIEKIGDIGKKLHTGRSRNDLVITDFMLYVREKVRDIREVLGRFLGKLIEFAKRYYDFPFMGYTHLQPAMPITLGFWAMGYFFRFFRVLKDIRHYEEDYLFLPLGCAALSGSSYDIDREYLLRELGFSSLAQNCIDVISSRDFVFRLHSILSLLMLHVSSLSEEFVIWSTFEFGYVELDDSIATGSSIMPHKKNPDVFELMRGKTARVVSNLVQIAMLLKSLPTSYNRDLQEDKAYLFESLDIVLMTLLVLNEVIEKVSFRREKIEDNISRAFLEATSLADYLVGKGMPFRDAHRVVGEIVRYAVSKGKSLCKLSIDEFRRFSDKFSVDVFDYISVNKILSRHKVIGGTAPSEVLRQIEYAENLLKKI
jgi:argininosuccinate lyase